MEIPPFPKLELPMNHRSGQALIEAALALPCLLILLAGLFVAGRAVSLSTSAESAAFIYTLREGRRQPDIGAAISRSILPHGTGVVLHSERKQAIPLVPDVLPSLEGRTLGTVKIHKDWKEAGRIAVWPELSTERRIEASVDCWNRPTPSGRNTATAVHAYVLLGSIR